MFTHQYFPQCHDTLIAMAMWGADSGVRLPPSVLSAPALAKNHASYERNAAAVGLLLREELGTGRIVRLSSKPLGFSEALCESEPNTQSSYLLLCTKARSTHQGCATTTAVRTKHCAKANQTHSAPQTALSALTLTRTLQT